jgi:hypothetical protein
LATAAVRARASLHAHRAACSHAALPDRQGATGRASMNIITYAAPVTILPKARCFAVAQPLYEHGG